MHYVKPHRSRSPKCRLIITSAQNSLGVLVVVVAVVEEAGAVETERGGWEVGGTAEDEEEREGVADSAAVGEKKGKSIMRLFQLEPSVGGPPHSQVDVQRVSHGIESLSMSPNSPESTEHVHTLSLSTVAGWGPAKHTEVLGREHTLYW